MSGPVDWIGVADVAAELKLSDRAAWELVRRLGVPMPEPGRAVIARARFLRADWEAARDAVLKPPPPRAPRARGAAYAVSGSPPSRPATPGASAASKLARLRKA